MGPQDFNARGLEADKLIKKSVDKEEGGSIVKHASEVPLQFDDLNKQARTSNADLDASLKGEPTARNSNYEGNKRRRKKGTKTGEAVK